MPRSISMEALSQRSELIGGTMVSQDSRGSLAGPIHSFSIEDDLFQISTLWTVRKEPLSTFWTLAVVGIYSCYACNTHYGSAFLNDDGIVTVVIPQIGSLILYPKGDPKGLAMIDPSKVNTNKKIAFLR